MRKLNEMCLKLPLITLTSTFFVLIIECATINSNVSEPISDGIANEFRVTFEDEHSETPKIQLTIKLRGDVLFESKLNTGEVKQVYNNFNSTVLVYASTTTNENDGSLMDFLASREGFEDYHKKLGDVKAVAVVVLLSKSSSNIVVTPAANETKVETSGELPNLRIQSRLQWLAQPSVEMLTTLNTPVSYVIIHQTATENCMAVAACVLQVRYIQQFQIENKRWWDIGYNFLVGGDGFAYEGRGWVKEGAHSAGYNSKSIGIGMIGTFTTNSPPTKQLVALKALIATGVAKGYIDMKYKLIAASQLASTQRPGNVLFDEIKTWPHWTDKL